MHSVVNTRMFHRDTYLFSLPRNWTVLVSTTRGSESAIANWQDRYDAHRFPTTGYLKDF